MVRITKAAPDSGAAFVIQMEEAYSFSILSGREFSCSSS